MFMGACSLSHAQRLMIVTGASFTNERIVFRNPSLKPLPIAFFTTGLTYVRKDDIMISLSYSFDIGTLNLATHIPIVSFKRKKK